MSDGGYTHKIITFKDALELHNKLLALGKGKYFIKSLGKSALSSNIGHAAEHPKKLYDMEVNKKVFKRVTDKVTGLKRLSKKYTLEKIGTAYMKFIK